MHLKCLDLYSALISLQGISGKVLKGTDASACQIVAPLGTICDAHFDFGILKEGLNAQVFGKEVVHSQFVEEQVCRLFLLERPQCLLLAVLSNVSPRVLPHPVLAGYR